MRCPKCSTDFKATPDEIGRVECPQCGARLRSRTKAVFKAQGRTAAVKPARATSGASAGQKGSARARRQDPDATVRAMEVDPSLARGAKARDARSEDESQTGPSSPKGIAGPATLETLLVEIRLLRKVQEEILSILKG
jgi:predicted  nucleic acid-binding Zn-ribbon protein